MITLNTVFEDAGIPPSDTLVIRHTPSDRALRKVMPWLVSERPDLFIAYQACQGEKLEAAMKNAVFLASFLDNGPKSAVFAGLYMIKGSRRLTFDSFWAVPENVELRSLGMTGMEPGEREPLMFDLQPMSDLSGWIGKLCVEWPGVERSWWRRAERNVMPISAIHAESLFNRSMPDWDEIALAWPELQLLPASWRAKLSEWRGIYFIFDVARERGYVGSAYGDENILGRWRNYAATGHGGNVRLRESSPADLRFSILQRVSPDMMPEEVIALEGLWKTRLHTRLHGLNEN